MHEMEGFAKYLMHLLGWATFAALNQLVTGQMRVQKPIPHHNFNFTISCN